MDNRTFSRQHGDRKACFECAKAKAKCLPSSPSHDIEGTCERCRRLRKHCSPQHIRERRQRQPKPASRGAQLEQKLDNLVSLIASSKIPQQNPDISRVDGGSFAPAFVLQQEARYGCVNDSQRLPMPHVPDDRTAGSSTNNTQWYDLEKTANLPSPITQLNRDEAEKLVNIWRTSFASSCSSVAIPSTVTFDELCRDSPFLAGTMATAALYTDLKRQIEMARCCLKYFTETLFIQGKKSLDLLQGLLVFFSWYHYHVMSNPQPTNLVALSNALCIDLGFQRPNDRNALQRFQLFAAPMKNALNFDIVPLSLEQGRAYLGTYYITSMISITFGRSEPLTWSARLEKSCKDLDETREAPNDALLVYTCRSQRLLERISREGSDITAGLTIDAASPVSANLRAWQLKLKDSRDSIPESIKDNELVQMLHHYTDIYLFDSALYALENTTSDNGLIKRVEYIYACFDSIALFFKVFLSIPSTLFHTLAFDTFARFASTITTLARLRTLDEYPRFQDDLDSKVKLNDVLEQAASMMDQAEEAIRQGRIPLEKAHLFSRWSWRLRQFQQKNGTKDISKSTSRWDQFVQTNAPEGEQSPSLEDSSTDAIILRNANYPTPASSEQRLSQAELDLIPLVGNETWGPDLMVNQCPMN